MSISTGRIAGVEETQDGSLVRGGVALLAGLLLCSAAILAQAALLQAVAGHHKKAN